MDLKPGSRWRSAVCDAEMVIVKPPAQSAVLECGGRAVQAHSEPRAAGLSPAPEHAAGAQLGKRYVDEASGLEVLCSKTGAGSLSVDGRALALKDAKKLPSSD